MKGKHAAASALAAACVGLNAAAFTASPLSAWASTADSSTFPTELSTRVVQGGGDVPATLTSSGPDEVFDRNSKDAYRKVGALDANNGELCNINGRFNALFDPAYKQGVFNYTVKHPTFKKVAV